MKILIAALVVLLGLVVGLKVFDSNPQIAELNNLYSQSMWEAKLLDEVLANDASVSKCQVDLDFLRNQVINYKSQIDPLVISLAEEMKSWSKEQQMHFFDPGILTTAKGQCESGWRPLVYDQVVAQDFSMNSDPDIDQAYNEFSKKLGESKVTRADCLKPKRCESAKAGESVSCC